MSSEPVLPYATIQKPEMLGRQLFGVVVRTLGLGLALYGSYTLAYAFAILSGVRVPSAGYTVATFLVFSLFWLVLGILLIHGEWLVRFAYGRFASQ